MKTKICDKSKCKEMENLNESYKSKISKEKLLQEVNKCQILCAKFIKVIKIEVEG